jgi:hypothetical protein
MPKTTIFSNSPSTPHTLTSMGVGLEENCSIYSYAFFIIFGSRHVPSEMPMQASSFCITVNAFGTLHVRQGSLGLRGRIHRNQSVISWCPWIMWTGRLARLNVRWASQISLRLLLLKCLRLQCCSEIRTFVAYVVGKSTHIQDGGRQVCLQVVTMWKFDTS